MDASSRAAERRGAVRLQPISDLPAVAHLLQGDALVALEVTDVSVGGLAVAARPSVSFLERGVRATVRLDLGRYGTFELVMEVRHRGGESAGMLGMQFVDPPMHVSQAVGRYVGELLERGALS